MSQQERAAKLRDLTTSMLQWKRAYRDAKTDKDRDAAWLKLSEVESAAFKLHMGS